MTTTKKPVQPVQPTPIEPPDSLDGAIDHAKIASHNQTIALQEELRQTKLMLQVFEGRYSRVHQECFSLEVQLAAAMKRIAELEQAQAQPQTIQ